MSFKIITNLRFSKQNLEMQTILQYAQIICENNLELRNFCDLNKSLRNKNLDPKTTSGSSLVRTLDFKSSEETFPMVEAIKKHADEAQWRQT